MTTYIIIETWNGEGYSHENFITGLFAFSSDEQALAKCNELAVENQSEATVTPFENGASFEVRYDHGSYQFFELHPEHYGVVIHCNVNKAVILTKPEYDVMLKDMLSRVTPEAMEEEEIDPTHTSVFIGAEAHQGDVDYQFQVIELDGWMDTDEEE